MKHFGIKVKQELCKTIPFWHHDITHKYIALVYLCHGNNYQLGAYNIECIKYRKIKIVSKKEFEREVQYLLLMGLVRIKEDREWLLRFLETEDG